MAVSNGLAITNGRVNSKSTAAIASSKWTANNLYMAAVGYYGIASEQSASITSFTAMPFAHGGIGFGINQWIQLFSFVGDGTTSAPIISIGTTVTDIQWVVNEFQNTALTSIFGTPAVATNSGSSFPAASIVTAFAAGSACFFADYHAWSTLQTPKSGFTTLAHNEQSLELYSMWDSADTRPSAVAGNSQAWVATAVEIKAPAGSNVYNVLSRDTATATDSVSITDILGGNSADNITATDLYTYFYQPGPNAPATGGSGWHQWGKRSPGGGNRPRRPF